MTVIDKYRKVAKDYAAQWKIEDDHIINIGASVLMTRDGELQGGSFVQAVVSNNLQEAINRADDKCIQHLRFFVGIKNNIGQVK